MFRHRGDLSRLHEASNIITRAKVACSTCPFLTCTTAGHHHIVTDDTTRADVSARAGRPARGGSEPAEWQRVAAAWRLHTCDGGRLTAPTASDDETDSVLDQGPKPCPPRSDQLPYCRHPLSPGSGTAASAAWQRLFRIVVHAPPPPDPSPQTGGHGSVAPDERTRAGSLQHSSALLDPGSVLCGGEAGRMLGGRGRGGSGGDGGAGVAAAAGGSSGMWAEVNTTGGYAQHVLIQVGE